MDIPPFQSLAENKETLSYIKNRRIADSIPPYICPLIKYTTITPCNFYRNKNKVWKIPLPSRFNIEYSPPFLYKLSAHTNTPVQYVFFALLTNIRSVEKYHLPHLLAELKLLSRHKPLIP